VELAAPDVSLLIADRVRRLLYYEVVDPGGLFLATRRDVVDLVKEGQ